MAPTRRPCKPSVSRATLNFLVLGRGVGLAGASRWSRTTDAGIFNPSLYLLSYRGIYGDLKHPLALLEPQMGLEPTSNGLEDRGSSIELLRRSYLIATPALLATLVNVLGEVVSSATK